MSGKPDSKDLISNAISAITTLLNDLNTSPDPKNQKRASLLSYWLSDYAKMLRKEDTFDPKKLIRYQRGQIVKVHLGYRIGSEEGGLHYAIVVENNNPLSSDVVTVIPLTSLKPKHDPNQLHNGEVYLGNEIYRILRVKLNTLTEKFNLELANAKAIQRTISERLVAIHELPAEERSAQSEKIFAELTEIDKAQTENNKNIDNVTRAQKRIAKVKIELSRMKLGSIALVNQITTISKQRIYDPLYRSDVFNEVRVSNEALDKLDAQVIAMFTNNSKEK